jgi:PST family polysaccharide transporter
MVIRVESLLFLCSGLGSVARALLVRDLAFRRLLTVDIVSYVLGYALVGIAGAFEGWAVWSLVGAALTQSLLANLLYVRAVKPPLRPLWGAKEARDLLGFGMKVSATTTVSYVARNGDYFLIGRLLGTGSLGLYSRAFKLMMLPIDYVCSTLFSVLTPAFAEIQHDRVRMGRGYLKSVKVAVLVTAPTMALLMVSAKHLVPALYGQKWAASILPLQILAAVGVAQAVEPLHGSIVRACDRMGLELVLHIAYATVVVVGTVIGARFGLPAVALLISIAIVIMYLVTAQVTLVLTRLRWRDFFAAQRPGLQLGAYAAGMLLLVRLLLESFGLRDFSILVLLVVAGMLAVPISIRLLPSKVRSEVPLDYLDAIVADLPPGIGRQLVRLKGALI